MSSSAWEGFGFDTLYTVLLEYDELQKRCSDSDSERK
jgi:hypothetical protein